MGFFLHFWNFQQKFIEHLPVTWFCQLCKNACKLSFLPYPNCVRCLFLLKVFQPLIYDSLNWHKFDKLYICIDSKCPQYLNRYIGLNKSYLQANCKMTIHYSWIRKITVSALKVIVLYEYCILILTILCLFAILKVLFLTDASVDLKSKIVDFVKFCLI